MPVENYQECIPVQAIKFEGMEQTHIQEIVGFVGLPISIDYTPSGLKLRVIRNALDVLVANVGEFIIKNTEGKLSVMTQAAFEARYTKVTA